MMHIVSFSTGIPSALTVEKVYNRYGPERLFVVFMDTLIEDEDNYRFQAEMYERWRDMGITNIITLEDGRTPLEIAEGQNLIPNQKIAPCTKKLKIVPFVKWLKEQPGQRIIYVGFDFTEQHRCARVSKNYEALGCHVDFPLLWKPYEIRPYRRVSLEDWGIEPPRMYKLGYSHANCGGRCVKQGWGDWVRTLINFPDRYATAEEWERRMRDHPKRKNYAFLRDQSAEQVRPKTLEQLREEYEEKTSSYYGGLFAQRDYLDELDMVSSCVRCGVGDFAPDILEDE